MRLEGERERDGEGENRGRGEGDKRGPRARAERARRTHRAPGHAARAGAAPAGATIPRSADPALDRVGGCYHRSMRAELRAAVREALGSCDFVAAVWVFGSVARAEAGPSSDLDLAVLLVHDGEATESEREALSRAAAVLEAYAPNGRVDVVVLGRAGPVLHHRVVRDGELVIDRSPARRIDFVARAIRDYLDWEPTHRIGMEAALEGLSRRLRRSAA